MRRGDTVAREDPSRSTAGAPAVWGGRPAPPPAGLGEVSVPIAVTPICSFPWPSSGSASRKGAGWTCSRGRCSAGGRFGCSARPTS